MVQIKTYFWTNLGQLYAICKSMGGGVTVLCQQCLQNVILMITTQGTPKDCQQINEYIARERERL